MSSMSKRSFDDMGESKQQQQQQQEEPKPMEIEEKAPRASLETLLSRPSHFGNETGSLPCGEFDPSTSSLAKSKVLVVGAGGLGCEILKDCALSGIRQIDVIDLDTIDVTNLNRQFLFRQADVGQSKAQTAARFIQQRCPWVTVTAHHGKIQDKTPDFYASFDCIIAGLDNVEARRWLNATVVGLVETDEDGDIDPTTIVPLIDGGTEGFSGQARFILPRITSCFECTLDAFPPATNFPLCTIAETPRKPEHCIAYAFILEWPRQFPDTKLDKDSPEHMQWVFEKARARAEEYSITGVTYMLTMGVVKNIIPAVASTNAIISAVCVNEACKYLSFGSQNLNNYMMYMGAQGIYSHTFEYGLKEDCPVSSRRVRKMMCTTDLTLAAWLAELKESLRLRSPSVVSATGKTLYMPQPVALEKATRANLAKPLSSLVEAGEELSVTDPLLQSAAMGFVLTFAD